MKILAYLLITCAVAALSACIYLVSIRDQTKQQTKWTLVVCPRPETCIYKLEERGKTYIITITDSNHLVTLIQVK